MTNKWDKEPSMNLQVILADDILQWECPFNQRECKVCNLIGQGGSNFCPQLTEDGLWYRAPDQCPLRTLQEVTVTATEHTGE